MSSPFTPPPAQNYIDPCNNAGYDHTTMYTGYWTPESTSAEIDFIIRKYPRGYMLLTLTIPTNEFKKFNTTIDWFGIEADKKTVINLKKLGNLIDINGKKESYSFTTHDDKEHTLHGSWYIETNCKVKGGGYRQKSSTRRASKYRKSKKTRRSRQ